MNRLTLCCLICCLAGCTRSVHSDKENPVRIYKQQERIWKLAQNQVYYSEGELAMEADRIYNERAVKAYKNSQQIKAITEEISGFLDDYLRGIRLYAGIDSVSTEFTDEYFREEKVRDWFVNHEKADAVIKILEYYFESVQRADSAHWDYIRPVLSLVNDKNDTTLLKHPEQFREYFIHCSYLDCITLFTRIKTMLLINEAEINRFYLDASKYVVYGYSKFASIFAQNSFVFKPGQKLEITAGVCEFSSSCLPSCTINNSTVERDENGVFLYHINVPQKPGRYHVNAKIKYTDQDGKEQVIETQIKYSVIDSCF